MILGAEIGLLILGIPALVTGQLTLTKTRVVEGTAARLLAIIALLPLPLVMVVGMVVGAVVVLQGGDPTLSSMRWTFTLIELAIVVGCIAALYAIGWYITRVPVLAPNPADSSGPRR